MSRTEIGMSDAPAASAAEFGQWVRRRRTALMLTQESLAEMTGLSVRTVRNLEAGRSGVPRLETQRLLTAVLKERAAVEPVDGAAPALLPAAVFGFAGRARELAELDEVRAEQRPVAVIVGTAGVGKTALAVHWAHRVRDQFPDGQLYVNLRGFDPGGRVMLPEEATRGFLEALGVPAERIPANVDARSALYRSQLAGKRVLVLLDNARDAEQVRPLLPGTPTALALVTSRRQLTGLVTAGAHPIALDVLSDPEARDLLAARLGADRTSAESEAVARIVTACARLPLALAIAAARSRQTGFPLDAIAAELADASRRLDVLDADDPATQVRAVFSWSLDVLSRPAARLFRLLGLHPGPHISAPAAASLAGVALPDARGLLSELAGANLVTEHVPGRFRFHDLLRAYAVEQAQADAEPQRWEAMHRVLDHYLHTAYAASQRMHPQRDQITVVAPRSGVTRCDLADVEQANAWLAAESAVLYAAIDRAAEAGFDTHAWQLSWCLADFLDQSGRWRDWCDVAATGLASAERCSDRHAQGILHRHLSRAMVLLGRYDEARDHLSRAVELFATLGDRAAQAHNLHSLALLCGRQGQPAQALAHANNALELFRAVGHLAGQARAHNTAGWYCAELGDLAAAREHCEYGIGLHQQTGNRHGEAATWDSLGFVHHRRGDYQEAVASYEHALELLHNWGDRRLEAMTLAHLGDSYLALTDVACAQDAFERALVMLDELHDPETESLRVKLRDIEVAP
jgi:tetratricopeptide (TPR) repeat protein/transcriptional regulator with XRE-family HTH domain